jgi:hypothetical protein
MIYRTLTTFCSSLLLLTLACAQEPAPKPLPNKQDAPKQDKQDKEDAPKQNARAQVLAILAEQGVHFDGEKKLVRAEGKINIVRDYLEFVAIGPRGKKHESLVMLKCLGSTLNTALALLKLGKGKNVDYKKVVPMPTQEEVENGAPTVIVIPPEGPKVHLALRWKDDKGKTITRAIEDLILDIRADRPLQDVEWIYFGGRMAALYKGEPPVFIADYEQNYISCYYVKPDNQLITIKHVRGNYDDNWWPNERLLPKKGSPCELIISLEPIVKRLPEKEAYPEAGERSQLEPAKEKGPEEGPEKGKEESEKKEGDKN